MSDQHHSSHAAHPRRQEALTAADSLPGKLPSQLLHAESELVRGMLEELDDVIFSAVHGDAEAQARAQVLWSQVVVEIGWDLVEESREQYLRYTVDVIQRLEYSPAEKPERAIAALEIISLLTKN